MWNEQKRYLETQLGPGEILLWSGPPKSGLLLRSSDVYTVPFSLLWCGFAVFWNVGVWYSDAPVFFRIWGLPFLVIGVYFVIGRFFMDAWQRAKTYYGVSNERIIIVSGIFSRNVRSLALRSLSDISISEKSDFSGTITFGPEETGSGRTGFSFSRQNNQVIHSAFESIQQAKNVYNIIRSAQKSTS
jgi:hypothetical protein